MTNQFMVQTREIFLFEESEFLAHGGRTVRFGAVDGNVVRLEATGSAGAIAYLARTIIRHRTAAS